MSTLHERAAIAWEAKKLADRQEEQTRLATRNAEDAQRLKHYLDRVGILAEPIDEEWQEEEGLIFRLRPSSIRRAFDAGIYLAESCPKCHRPVYSQDPIRELWQIGLWLEGGLREQHLCDTPPPAQEPSLSLDHDSEELLRQWIREEVSR